METGNGKKNGIKEAAKESLDKQVQRRNQAVSSLADVEAPRKHLVQLFEQSRQQFENLIKTKEDVNRILRVAITYMNKNPKLWKCTPQSVLGCLFESTQLGLEIGVLGQGDMIARRNNKADCMEANFQPGYQGLLLLAQRTGTIATIMSEVVYDGDHFIYRYGSNATLEHTPSFKSKAKRDRLCAYAYAKTTDGGFYFVVMSMEDLERIRKYSQAPDSPAWINEQDWMYRKTALRQLSKMLPKETSKEAIKFWRATVLDEAESKGLNQGLSIEKIEDDGFLTLNERDIFDDKDKAPQKVEEAQFKDLPTTVIYEPADPDPSEVNDPAWYIGQLEAMEKEDNLDAFMTFHTKNISCFGDRDQRLIKTVYNSIKLSLSKRAKE